MGTVYRATQNSLHRTVALKVLSPQLAHDPEFVELFLKEARAAAQLHHPNVVTIFDVGSAGNTHYFSMEVFDGGSVEQWLRREKRLPVDRALTMTRDAAKALEFAESKHILHRDVKPDDLMVTAQGVVKLADLGIAARRGEETTGRFGTPHFVAPECIKGASADHRSDLYSLGATLFRMLTGRTPFQGANVGEILDAVQRTEAPRLREIDPNIPEGSRRSSRNCYKRIRRSASRAGRRSSPRSTRSSTRWRPRRKLGFGSAWGRSWSREPEWVSS